MSFGDGDHMCLNKGGWDVTCGYDSIEELCDVVGEGGASVA